MWSVLAYSFNAVAPVLLMILLGYFLKQKGVFTDDTIRSLSKFIFKLPFFCMMFVNVYSASSLEHVTAGLLAVILTILATITGVAFAAAQKATGVRNRKGVIIQAAFRSNYAIIGLPVAASLAGDGARVLASIFQIPVIIYYNLTAVIVLNLYGETREGEKLDLGKTIHGIVTNPMILGLLMGGFSLLVRSRMPLRADGELLFCFSRDMAWLYEVFRYLAGIATSMALVVLGGQLDMQSIGSYKRELVTGVLLRLIVSPAIGFAIAFGAAAAGVISLTPDVVAVLVSILASPVAIVSVIMTREMHGDDKLAAQTVVWSTVFGMLTLFLLITGLRTAGYL